MALAAMLGTAPLVAMAAPNDVILNGNVEFEVATADTGVLTTIVGTNGGTAAVIDVQSNYIDVTLEATSSIHFENTHIGTVRYFKVTPQSGTSFNKVLACPVNDEVTLTGTGTPTVVRIELVTTSTICTGPTGTGGSGGGGGFSPEPNTNSNSNGVTNAGTNANSNGNSNVNASSQNTNSNGTGTGATLGSVDGDVPFTDVVGHWAQTYITQLYKMKVVQGRTATTFEPDTPMTRAEVTKVALLLFGYDVPEATSTFTDVPADAWYSKYVAAAKAAGIVGGYSDNTFHPDAEVSRAEALKIMLAASKLSLDKAPESPFFDVASSDWYAPYVAYAFAKEIVSGKTPTLFAPDDSITRAEMTKIALKTFVLKQ